MFLKQMSLLSILKGVYNESEDTFLSQIETRSSRPTKTKKPPTSEICTAERTDSLDGVQKLLFNCKMWRYKDLKNMDDRVSD